RWRRQLHGAHTRLELPFARSRGVDFQHYNQHGIGIALVGNFDKSRPSAAQLAALERLVTRLVEVCHIPESAIYTHGEVDQTGCPGAYCSIDDLRQKLRNPQPSSN